MRSPNPTDERAALRRLAAMLARNGCIREPNPARFPEGHRAYKKGWEARFVADSGAEVEQIRRLIAEAGLRPGRAYAKVNQWIVPVYGREAVARIRAAVARRGR